MAWVIVIPKERKKSQSFQGTKKKASKKSFGMTRIQDIRDLFWGEFIDCRENRVSDAEWCWPDCGKIVSGKWVASLKKVPNDLSRCHTKRKKENHNFFKGQKKRHLKVFWYVNDPGHEGPSLRWIYRPPWNVVSDAEWCWPDCGKIVSRKWQYFVSFYFINVK